jgi:hypothetical protein
VRVVLAGMPGQKAPLVWGWYGRASLLGCFRDIRGLAYWWFNTTPGHHEFRSIPASGITAYFGDIGNTLVLEGLGARVRTRWAAADGSPIASRHLSKTEFNPSGRCRAPR